MLTTGLRSVVYRTFSIRFRYRASRPSFFMSRASFLIFLFLNESQSIFLEAALLCTTKRRTVPRINHSRSGQPRSGFPSAKCQLQSDYTNLTITFLHTALERGKGPTPTGDDYRVAS